MSDNNTTKSEFVILHKISIFISLGYIAIGFVTYFLLLQFKFARDLFRDTELIIFINAVWFSLGIVGYGLFSLNKNYRRIKLTGIKQSIDTQFLIVLAFLFFSINQIVDFVIVAFDELDPITVTAL